MRILQPVQTASFIGLLLLPCVPAGWSFEVDTHGRISQSAFDQSVLGKSYLEEELGLDRERPLGSLTPRAWL